MRKSLLLTVAAFWLLATGAALAAPTPIKPGAAPADTTLKRLDNGAAVRVSKLYGKRGTLVYFWHPRCPLCVDQYRQLQKQRLPAGIGLITLVTAKPEDLIKAREIAKQVKVLALEDTAYQMAIQFQASVVPAYYILGPGGALVTTRMSPEKGLKEKIDYYDDKTIPQILDYVVAMAKSPPLVQPQDQMVGKPAPPINLKDLNGKLVTLGSYKGAKGLVVIFYSPTCPHCQRELPKISDYLKTRGFGLGYKVVTIALANSEENLQNIKEYQDTMHYPWPVLADVSGAVMADWKVAAYPTLYLVGPDLKVKAFKMGEFEGIQDFFEKGK